jgi:ubiquinone/menaquinone biosynthesis C-methylase UbiE
MKDKFKKSQEKYYQNLAKKFDLEQKRENRNHINKIKAISNFLDIKKGDKVLEIGVGTGIHGSYLLKLNKIKFIFTGVDLSKEMLIEARKKLKKYSNVKLKQMDGENLKFKDNYFDKVYISGSLHHFPNPKKGIEEILRILKKGGKFCIMEPNYYFPTNYYSANTITEEKNIRLMKRKNFKEWLVNKKINYTIKNFAYTPPFPKFLIPMYNILDKVISKIPILNRLSVMLFIKGMKR